MKAHGQVNVLAAAVRRLPPRPSPGEWHVRGGLRYLCVAAPGVPGGVAWRVVSALDFTPPKTP